MAAWICFDVCFHSSLSTGPRRFYNPCPGPAGLRYSSGERSAASVEFSIPSSFTFIFIAQIINSLLAFVGEFRRVFLAQSGTYLIYIIRTYTGRILVGDKSFGILGRWCHILRPLQWRPVASCARLRIPRMLHFFIVWISSYASSPASDNSTGRMPFESTYPMSTFRMEESSEILCAIYHTYKTNIVFQIIFFWFGLHVPYVSIPTCVRVPIMVNHKTLGIFVRNVLYVLCSVLYKCRHVYKGRNSFQRLKASGTQRKIDRKIIFRLFVH